MTDEIERLVMPPKNIGPFLGDEAQDIMRKILDLEGKTLSTAGEFRETQNTLDEKLFDAKAKVKVFLSQVSMHFTATLREKLHHQIDLIHDPDDWDEADKPIQLQSFRTFLRWFYSNDPMRLPNFGLTSQGHFIASWLTNSNKDRLILEFLSDDSIKWFVTKHFGEKRTHSIGTTELSLIKNILTPFCLEDWFSKEA